MFTTIIERGLFVTEEIHKRQDGNCRRILNTLTLATKSHVIIELPFRIKVVKYKKLTMIYHFQNLVRKSYQFKILVANTTGRANEASVLTENSFSFMCYKLLFEYLLFHVNH